MTEIDRARLIINCFEVVRVRRIGIGIGSVGAKKNKKLCLNYSEEKKNNQTETVSQRRVVIVVHSDSIDKRMRMGTNDDDDEDETRV